MSTYHFDQSMTGLLSCVYRSFQFKDFDVKLASNNSQASLFDECIEVASNDEHAERVWRGLKQKITAESLRSFVIYAGVDDNNLSFSGLNLALANPNTDLRIFGKPEGFTRRRMGVATARAETTDQARELAVQAAGLVSVHQN
jgi:hypothetical protein